PFLTLLLHIIEVISLRNSIKFPASFTLLPTKLQHIITEIICCFSSSQKRDRECLNGSNSQHLILISNGSGHVDLCMSLPEEIQTVMIKELTTVFIEPSSQ